MRVTAIGRGNVGGGLARLWKEAGHEVTVVGRDGGDASNSDAVLLAVPSDAIDKALASVPGVEGKVVLDATNPYAGRAEGFDSLAHQVKARTRGPVAKAFNINFAAVYDQISNQSSKPGCLYCGDEEAREITERLIQDAGYEPVPGGGLENARALEDFLAPAMAIAQATGGPFFYRFAPPGRL